MRTKINLREHQVPMAERADNLYAEGKNFAGVILATGGGKSFIAMDQIVKFANSYNDENPLSEEDRNRTPKVFSNVPCYYFSPTNIILYQFKLHMAQNIMAPEYVLDYIDENGQIAEGNEIQIVKDILTKMNSRVNFSEINFEDLLEDVKKTSESSNDVVSSLLKVSLEQIQPKQLEKMVDDAFPNINFTTYQALEQATDEEIAQMQANFIIFDEAHRAGAEKWWPKVQTIIKNTKAKVLAITATPERDVDEKDMMRDLALLPSSGYSVREVRNKNYLAGNMPLLKAIEGNHLLPPDVVHFNCKLDETPEFENAIRSYIKSAVKLDTIRSGTDRYYNAMNSQSVIENAIIDMLVLIRKNPLIDYDETLTPEEKEARKKEDEINVRKQIKDRAPNGYGTVGLIADFTSIVRDGIKRKLSEDEILDQCMHFLRNPEWEDLKKQRISTIITKEVKARGIEEGKALNFIESMENGPKGESKEDKKIRAKNHIARKIDELKALFDESIMKMPTITAVHSEAFTKAENDEILNRFMQKVSDGKMKIIAAVSKFNEGFHPDGVRALFMTKPIQQNEKKQNEPRIILLQQIGRCLSAGQKEPSVIFDTACNFMRNHEKFRAESTKDCFAFLRLSKEETDFLRLAKTISQEDRKKAEEKPDTDKLMSVLAILKKNGVEVDSDKIPNDITLEDYIKTIPDEKTREKVLDDLFLKEIEMETDGAFNLGSTYRYARSVYLGIEEDQTTLKRLAKKSLKEMLDLGIIETKTKEGKESLNGRINRAGFIVRGVVAHTFAYNVYTGTKFDGPESDLDRKDYFGCGPDGRDPAGFDRYGFDENGIHRVTGKHYNERHFVPVKETDAKGKENVTWYYENPKTGERTETDPLGFNYEGINPITGFDRQGYWHRREEDGGFSIIRSRLNDEKMDCHNFLFKSIKEKLGLYHGVKGLFTTNKGLYSNGTISQNGSTRLSDRYGHDGYDLDGFNPKGFNNQGIHKDTSAEYGLDGKDRDGRMQIDLKIASEILNLLATGKIKPEDLPRRIGKSAEEVDKVLGNAFSISRTLTAIQREKNPESNSDVIGLLKMTKENPKAVDALFKLSPSMRSQVEKAVLDNKRMNGYYSRRTDKIISEMLKGKNEMKAAEQEELEELDANLKRTTGSVEYRRPEEDDFVL